MFTLLSNLLPNRFTQTLVAAYFKISVWRSLGFRGVHSSQVLINLQKMKIRILPALQDNYMYLIIDEQTKEAAIVDPVDPDTVLAAVKGEDEAIRLTTVLTTHHHWDHAGGNQALVNKVSHKLNVYGGDKRIEALTHPVEHGYTFNIGNIQVECLSTPCHTSGHICYYLTDAQGAPVVFTGDTLFVGGCGRFFEGTAEQMYSSLIDKLGKLPDNTQVFCGHEYTVQNLKFAKYVEAHNEDVLNKLSWATKLRSNNQPTVPSTIADEKKTNPFMRVDVESVKRHTGSKTGVETMHIIRKEKDTFKTS